MTDNQIVNKNNSYKDENVASQLYPTRSPKVELVRSNSQSVSGGSTIENFGNRQDSGNFNRPGTMNYFEQNRSHRKLWVLIILIMIIFSYVAFLYTKDFGPFGKPPFSPENIVAGIVGGSGTIDSADYTLNLVVKVKLKGNNLDPLIIKAPPANASYKSSLLYNLLGTVSNMKTLPDDFMLDVNISGGVIKAGNHYRSDQMKVIANASINNRKMNVDTVFSRLSDEDYVVANKLITISDRDADIKSGSYFGSFLDQDSLNQIAIDNSKQIKMALLLASKYKLFESKTEPIKEYINWNTFYRYDLELNKENFIEFYTSLVDEFSKQNPGIPSLMIDRATLEYIKTSDFNQVFEYIKKNSKFTIWVDTRGIPTRMEYYLIFSPLRTSSQIEFSLKGYLSNINKATTAFVDPGLGLTGQSKEQYQFDYQLNSIATLRKALANYKISKGAYPANLDELVNVKDVTEYAYALGSVPKDIYSGTSFTYEGKGQDYSLKYKIQLPTYTKGDSLKRIFTFDYASGSLAVIMKAVEGENTANVKYLSEQAFTQSKVDTDGDKLPDIIEKYMGSGIGTKDTDADGRSDYTEVMNDSNPLGAGNLKGGGEYWF